MKKIERFFEQRYAIKFCTRLKKSATETLKILHHAFAEYVMSHANAKWNKELKNERGM